VLRVVTAPRAPLSYVALVALVVNGAVGCKTGPTPDSGPTTGRDLPATVAANVPVDAAVELRFADGDGCSGVRVAEELVLSAAHCATGFDGARDVVRFRWKFGGSAGELERVEMGKFDPPSDQLHDWMILRGKLASGPVARLATVEELARLRQVGDVLDERSQPIVLATFPDHATRVAPRPAITGDGRFVSTGFAKSPRAYRASTVLAARGLVYDDQSNAPPPAPPPDLDAAWVGLDGVASVFDAYARIEGALLYHSADYAPGSSGGGGFLANGHLVGIVPLGATPKGLSRSRAFLGVGQLFAVDAICRESSVLKAAGLCGGTLRESVPRNPNER